MKEKWPFIEKTLHNSCCWSALDSDTASADTRAESLCNKNKIQRCPRGSTSAYSLLFHLCLGGFFLKQLASGMESSAQGKFIIFPNFSRNNSSVLASVWSFFEVLTIPFGDALRGFGVWLGDWSEDAVKMIELLRVQRGESGSGDGRFDVWGKRQGRLGLMREKRRNLDCCDGKNENFWKFLRNFLSLLTFSSKFRQKLHENFKTFSEKLDLIPIVSHEMKIPLFSPIQISKKHQNFLPKAFPTDKNSTLSSFAIPIVSSTINFSSRFIKLFVKASFSSLLAALDPEPATKWWWEHEQRLRLILHYAFVIFITWNIANKQIKFNSFVIKLISSWQNAEPQRQRQKDPRNGNFSPSARVGRVPGGGFESFPL